MAQGFSPRGFQESFTPRAPQTMNPLAMLWQALQAPGGEMGVANPMAGPALAGIEAVGPRAAKLLEEALQVFAPRVRNRLVQEGARRLPVVNPDALASTTDFMLAPRDLFRELAGRYADPETAFAKGVFHGKIGDPKFPIGKAIRPGILVGEERVGGFFNPRVTAVHELGHALWAQLRPSTFNVMVNKLSDPKVLKELRKGLTQRIHGPNETQRRAAEQGLEVLGEFQATLAHKYPGSSRVVNLSAEEVFSRMLEGSIPPIKMVEKFMSELGRMLSRSGFGVSQGLIP